MAAKSDKKPLDPRLKLIAHKLKQLRLRKGYTSYEQFAFDHQLSRVGYGKHEAGTNLTMGSLLRILDIHGVNLQEFFADWQEPKEGDKV